MGRLGSRWGEMCLFSAASSSANPSNGNICLICIFVAAWPIHDLVKIYVKLREDPSILDTDYIYIYKAINEGDMNLTSHYYSQVFVYAISDWLTCGNISYIGIIVTYLWWQHIATHAIHTCELLIWLDCNRVTSQVRDTLLQSQMKAHCVPIGLRLWSVGYSDHRANQLFILIHTCCTLVN